MSWFFIGGLAVGVALLATRAFARRQTQAAAADASGLMPVRDLSHIPEVLQRTALWTLADGGFEQRVVHGVVSRGAESVDVTAFDIETLRERRGEWAYLPVEPPFRIGGIVSIVVCEIDRRFPHCLLKHVGHGDALEDDHLIDRSAHLAKLARDGLGLARSYPADVPASLSVQPLDVKLPVGWRAYGTLPDVLAALVGNGLGAALERADRRDLVVELIDGLVILYPAAHSVVSMDAFGDLTTTALVIVDGLLAASPQMSPRGIESLRPVSDA